MRCFMSRQIITERQNKVVYSEGKKCYKVFGSDYNKASILNEAHNQSLVEETGLNIPALLEREDVSQIQFVGHYMVKE